MGRPGKGKRTETLTTITVSKKAKVKLEIIDQDRRVTVDNFSGHIIFRSEVENFDRKVKDSSNVTKGRKGKGGV